MDKKKWLKEFAKTTAKVCYEFSNSAGEDFVVYKYDEMPAYLVTGDEFDWEGGWMLQKGDFKEAIQIFNFSGEEQNQLRKFWDENFKQEQTRFESTHKERKTAPVDMADITKPKEKENEELHTEETTDSGIQD